MKTRVTWLLLGLPLALAAAGNAVLWVQPTDAQSRDLFYGPGGKEHEPKGPFTFLKEDLDGTNPKFDVRDPDGQKWKIKMGVEAGPETVASRLLWAVGYFANEDYFRAAISVEGLPSKLKRGEKYRAGDRFTNVRLKRAGKSAKADGYWKWKENPFVNTREMNGLRTMMALINNWDLKDVNNAIVPGKGGSEVYLVKDLGASFGTNHLVKSHEVAKGNLKSFEESKFILKKEGQTVDFATPGKASFVFVVNPHETFSRIGMEWIGRDVPVADARWVGELLGQLTPTQIRDAFHAGGYVGDELEAFAKLVEKRIAELKAL